ncbi:MAG: hypothetical protein CMH52_11710 [Myxococcales bacterium]|nr:hypothetical protein [Myxococcales bacterium]
MVQPTSDEDVVGAIKGFFDDEERAVEEFFDPRLPRRVNGRTIAKNDKPTHYKVVSISLYNEDIARLNELVQELKKRGHSRASKSMLIREALRQLDLDDVPRQS